MALLEDRTASFIVRVWLESGSDAASAREWRGVIEQVGSGKKIYFRELNAIVEFMKPRLEEIGIDWRERFWEQMSETIESPSIQDFPPTEENSAVGPETLDKKIR
ncbi:MAG TPA: hypothetical protein PLF92_00920 [Arenimonas sp.]|nr:hypothetical protein [Arenimonas sp.]HOZ05702.1 hypothetical protein [Arenimonas sp.]HPO23042.1 hypothetical protein [Arenimonas sp.]HPW31445.1 hypothetical protein [Arenimonas sp.]